MLLHLLLFTQIHTSWRNEKGWDCISIHCSDEKAALSLSFSIPMQEIDLSRASHIQLPIPAPLCYLCPELIKMPV